MAFEVGSIVAKAIFDDSAWKNGIGGAKKSNAGLTKSLITSQLAVDALKKVMSESFKIVKKSIKNAIDYTEISNKFNVVFGDGKKVINDAAEAFDNLTTNYGLGNKEAKELLSSTGDLLTGLGFSQQQAIEYSESIQELSVDLASFQNLEGGAKQASEALTKALLGETESAKSLGIVIRQNTKEFRDNVKELVENNGLTEQQAKAQLILQQAFEQSKNAVGDYARTSMSLANMQRQVGTEFENLSTSIGSLFLPLMDVLVKQTFEGVNSLNKFFEQQENLTELQGVIGKATAGFEVFSAVLKDIGKGVFENIVDATDDIMESFNALIDSMKENILSFETMAGLAEIIGIALSIVTKIVKINIQHWLDWRTILINTGKALVAVFQALVDPRKWAEAKEQLDEVGASFQRMAQNTVEGIGDIISGTVEQFKDFPKNVEVNADKYEKIWNGSLEKTKKSFESNSNDVVAIEKNKGDAINEEDEKVLKNRENILKEWDSLQKKSLKDQISGIMVRKNAFIDAGIEEKEAAKQTNKEIRQAWGKQLTETLNLVTSVASEIGNVYQGIFDVIMGFQEQELEQLKAKHEAEIEELETAKEERLLSFDEETEAELEAVAEKEAQGVLTQEQAAAKTKEIEERRAKEKKQLEKNLDKEIADEKQKNRQKESEKEKQIFEANKANSIAMVWLQAAIGIMGAWAQSISQLGPIAGSIFAAILTTAILGTAIAQTVLISQQQFIPAREKGGMAGGITRVNESGGEIITLPDGSQVIPNDISRQIAAGSDMGNNIVMNVSFRGAMISDSMSLKKVSDNVSMELGRRLEVALQ